MTGIKLIGCMLHLRGILRIKRFAFKKWGKELHLWVKPYRNGCRCPECGRRGRILRTMSEQRCWRDVRVCGMDVYLHYAPREIRCTTHGRRQESIPWAAPHAQITYRLEVLVLRYCQSMTQCAAAQLLNMSPSTLSGVLHRTIDRIRSGHRVRALRTIGIDEISYERGRSYATIVYDLDRGCVVWVGDGKGRETIDRFFKTQMSPFQRANVRFASCDMSQTYIGAIKDWCPRAQLVIDRFHVVKALNDAVDEVRKNEWRKLKDTTEGKAIKGLRWLLYRHSTNRTPSQSRVLNSLRKSNRRIWRAWVLKDEFESFWEYTYPGAAQSFVKRWMTSALKSRLEPLRGFVKTLRNHLGDIITFVGTRLTNAVGEGVNRIIRMVKNRASGFQNITAFSDLIYLTVGDLDIPAQIPKRFHTY